MLSAKGPAASNTATDRRRAIQSEVDEFGFVRVSDLARRFGVSRVTAWRDIENLVRAGRVVKFHGGAGRAEVTADQPRSPARHDRLTIGMQIPDDHQYYSEVIAGVRETCEAAGARLLVASSGYGDSAHDRDTLNTLVSAGADGLLATPAEDPGLKAFGIPHEVIADLGRPVILVERDIAGILDAPWESVLTSYEPAVMSAIDHLIGLGHRRIGLATVPLQIASRRHIITTFDQILGPEARDRRWISVDDPVAMLPGVMASGTTGIIVYGDRLAAAMAYGALTHDIAVPTDLSIVSIGDEVGDHTLPPLTAVAQRRRFLGRLAARRLLGHLDGTSELARLRIRIDPNFIIRESTAPPRSR